MISKLTLENFSLFQNKCEIGFSSKINLIIGENGTGKTQLLKAAYALSKISNLDEVDRDQVTGDLLKKIFKPKNDRLGKMVTNGISADNSAMLRAEFPIDAYSQVHFNSRSKNRAEVISTAPVNRLGDPCFIPAKEILSMVHGFKHPDADVNTIERIFDETFFDLAQKISIKPEIAILEKIQSNPRLGSLYIELANTINGVFTFNSEGHLEFESGHFEEGRAKEQNKYGDKYITKFVKDRKNPISGNMVAEGIRKIGAIQRLLENGSLLKESNTTLFWDEPEANLNPSLMKLLVEMILEISRNGIQVVIATHDYMLLKWFEILKKPELDDHILYHSLGRRGVGDISIDSDENYLEIEPNLISKAFSDISVQDAKKRLERLSNDS